MVTSQDFMRPEQNFFYKWKSHYYKHYFIKVFFITAYSLCWDLGKIKWNCAPLSVIISSIPHFISRAQWPYQKDRHTSNTPTQTNKTSRSKKEINKVPDTLFNLYGIPFTYSFIREKSLTLFQLQFLQTGF